jgi:hypothetical protein
VKACGLIKLNCRLGGYEHEKVGKIDHCAQDKNESAQTIGMRGQPAHFLLHLNVQNGDPIKQNHNVQHCGVKVAAD